MVSKVFTSFLCVCCWLHGATVGVAIGDALDLQHFFLLSVGVFFAITVIYPTSRRLAVSAMFLACAVFLSALVKSLAFFRTPNHHSALPDVGHDFLPSIPIPPSFLLQLVLGATATFVALHPLRSIILRRVLLIYAALLMARTLLALMTFLPDSNPTCLVEEKNPSARETNVSLVACRDTIYCGHSTLLILCGMVWHTYYHRVESPVNWVKSIVWTTAITAMVSSLARRETYTLDAVLSTYFAVTGWATYHRLANDVLTGQRFTCVWLIDKVIVYPLVEWMEEEEHVKKPREVRLYRRDTQEQGESPPPKKTTATFRTSEF
ncbi:hypothetical protein SPRG_10812 [Saprolegnia parasitica CBS 223.65]|uniref:Sphingomyelin synthase-like domain-containing protein n=1 Tax=Saprolegnia parasitica (strain CBS 223.65) TaxID=695850 RepID=A0A067BZQ9_SAPPC|nr:hypothetical protein SPRG_10812 [Saprolegnia parasitica CBS 223.65]KDO24024.1 hypothetical protein SPRG_10812 [Saprolegnia parasitica CBS 223.65]|eukprot:XP_012205163.1 hypothetical protein SPRG_10812 [Saprolegnia parasitica CBS 223.65]